MVKVTKKTGLRRPGTRPLDPRLVTMTGLWPVMVTIKFVWQTRLYKIRQKVGSRQGQLRHKLNSDQKNS